MKLKLIAAAAVLAASGVANAAIDRGTDGSGDFFFTIWDSASSYTADMGFEQSQFVTALAAPGDFNFTLALNNDALFQSFIQSANLAELQWNVMAVEGVGNRTINQTFTPGTLPEQAQTATNGRALVQNVVTYLGGVNDVMLANNSVVFDSTNPNYANNNFGCIAASGTQEFSNCGTTANNSIDTGLNLLVETYNGSGTARGAFATAQDNGIPLVVYLDSAYNLNMVAAVPEPETYAMLLAGLGLMGAIARRRQFKA